VGRVGETEDWIMDKSFQVLRVRYKGTPSNSREWMKFAVEEFAKELIAQECVKVKEEYDFEGQRYIMAYSILSGAPRRALP